MMPRILSNAVGICLAVIHAAILLAALGSKQPMPPSRPCRAEDSTAESICFDAWDFAGQSVIANRPFHWHYEAWPVKVIMLADVPALLMAEVAIGPPMAVAHFPRVLASYVAAFGWLVFGSVEWWIFGVLLAGLAGRQRSEGCWS